MGALGYFFDEFVLFPRVKITMFRGFPDEFIYFLLLVIRESRNPFIVTFCFLSFTSLFFPTLVATLVGDIHNLIPNPLT